MPGSTAAPSWSLAKSLKPSRQVLLRRSQDRSPPCCHVSLHRTAACFSFVRTRVRPGFVDPFDRAKQAGPARPLRASFLSTALGQSPWVSFPAAPYVGPACVDSAHSRFFPVYEFVYISRKLLFYRKDPHLHAYNNLITVHRIKISYI